MFFCVNGNLYTDMLTNPMLFLLPLSSVSYPHGSCKKCHECEIFLLKLRMRDAAVTGYSYTELIMVSTFLFLHNFVSLKDTSAEIPTQLIFFHMFLPFMIKGGDWGFCNMKKLLS